jgi:hypothetical protein
VTTLLRERRPTARKRHHCEDCNGLIPAGTAYHRATLIYDGAIYDWVTCDDCDQLVSTVWRWVDPVHDEGVGRDEFLEWAEAHLDDPEHGDAARAFLARAVTIL